MSSSKMFAEQRNNVERNDEWYETVVFVSTDA